MLPAEVEVATGAVEEDEEGGVEDEVDPVHRQFLRTLDGIILRENEDLGCACDSEQYWCILDCVEKEAAPDYVAVVRVLFHDCLLLFIGMSFAFPAGELPDTLFLAGEGIFFRTLLPVAGIFSLLLLPMSS